MKYRGWQERKQIFQELRYLKNYDRENRVWRDLRLLDFRRGHIPLVGTNYIVYLCLYRTFTKSIYSRPSVCSSVATTSGLQSRMIAARVESISDVIKGLGVISCDSCQGKLASFDVYVNSSITNVPFLKRYCSDCIQNITC
jgi:hypothetical protein